MTVLSGGIEQNIIIGGTEKAGTTSIFEYLALHPAVAASTVKETDYFRRTEVERDEYYDLFFNKIDTRDVFLEASPAYLSLFKSVIPNIKKTLDNPYFIFIIRDPIDRFRSSYKFHQSKFYMPKDLSIDDYFSFCKDYDSGFLKLDDSPFDNEWFLNVLGAGKYAECISAYEDAFPGRVLVLKFEDLNMDAESVVRDICEFTGLDFEYYKGFNYHRANQTFNASNSTLHKLGMSLNKKFESYFRRNPKLKRFLVSIYRFLNESKGNDELSNYSDATINDMIKYYKADYQVLRIYMSKVQGRLLNWRRYE